MTISAVLIPVISAMISALLAWYLTKPKQKAETEKLTVDASKGRSDIRELEIKIANQVVALSNDAIQKLQAELEKWKAEFNVQAAIFAEKERKWDLEKRELSEQFRQCVERERLGSLERAAILDAQNGLSLKFEQQIASTESLKEQFLLLTARIEAMKGNG